MGGLNRWAIGCGTALLATVVMFTGGCRFRTSNGDQGDPIVVTDRERDQAFDAERRVLEKIDAKRYSEVWDEGSPSLKNAAGREGFMRQCAAMHRLVPAGRPRTLGEGRFHSARADLPPGRYVTFNNRLDCGEAKCGEVVVLMQVDGDWRLTGYFVRKFKLHKF